MKILKRILLALLIIFVVVCITVCVLLCMIRYRRTEVVKITSPDGEHTAVVTQIGEPEWPFGPSHCELDLYKGKKKVTGYRFDIYDDGGNAYEGNFGFRWTDDGMCLTVTASEQPETVYMVPFDGGEVKTVTRGE